MWIQGIFNPIIHIIYFIGRISHIIINPKDEIYYYIIRTMRKTVIIIIDFTE